MRWAEAWAEDGLSVRCEDGWAQQPDSTEGPIYATPSDGMFIFRGFNQ